MVFYCINFVQDERRFYNFFLFFFFFSISHEQNEENFDYLAAAFYSPRQMFPSSIARVYAFRSPNFSSRRVTRSRFSNEFLETRFNPRLRANLSFSVSRAGPIYES